MELVDYCECIALNRMELGDNGTEWTHTLFHCRECAAHLTRPSNFICVSPHSSKQFTKFPSYMPCCIVSDKVWKGGTPNVAHCWWSPFMISQAHGHTHTHIVSLLWKRSTLMQAIQLHSHLPRQQHAFHQMSFFHARLYCLRRSFRKRHTNCGKLWWSLFQFLVQP